MLSSYRRQATVIDRVNSVLGVLLINLDKVKSINFLVIIKRMCSN